MTRKQEAALWREIGERFEDYYETGLVSDVSSKGLCWAWKCVSDGDNSFYYCFGSLNDSRYDPGFDGLYERRNAGVRALFAYLMAEVCPFTSGLISYREEQK